MENYSLKSNRAKISFRDLYRVIKPWWQSNEKWIGYLGLLSLILLSILGIYLAVQLNTWTRDFYQIIATKAADQLMSSVLTFCLLVAGSLFISCTQNYLSMWLSFRWRTWCTEKSVQKWIGTKAYYTMHFSHSITDNPDQRISDDIATLCSFSISFFITLFKEITNIITFSIILWGLSTNFIIHFFDRSLQIPGFLIGILLIYAAIGSVLVFKIGKPIISLDVMQEKLEANFRYKLMRVKERREEISQLKGEPFEKKSLKSAFIDIRKNYHSLIGYAVPLNFFQNFYEHGNTLVPIIIAAPQFFSGAITFGVLMQINNTFGRISYSASVLVTNFNHIAQWLAAIYRINVFENHMTQIEAMKVTHQKTPSTLVINDLTIHTPQNNIIWQVPSLTLNAGERKLIRGYSGRGKSSLIRAIAEVYPFFKGLLQLPEDAIFIVPQRPYMPIGTLVQALSYPSNNFAKESLMDVLQACELAHLIDKLDQTDDWQNRLSIGEQQRVSFARTLLHKPTWLIMDEPTANLSQDVGDYLINLLMTRLENASILIISHQSYGSEHFDEIIQANEAFKPAIA